MLMKANINLKRVFLSKKKKKTEEKKERKNKRGKRKENLRAFGPGEAFERKRCIR